jgi:amidohydrolase
VDHKTRAQESLTAAEVALYEMSRWMYDNPEIGHQEHRTSARLASFMGERGFRVTHPAYGLETAFAARSGTAGPEVVICAELDALPGVGHACGHNIIAAAGLGAGIALSDLADDLGIRVTVLGTPAEEKLGGKVDLIDAGAFAEAAAAMMIHPSPEDTLDPKMLAVVHKVVEFEGKTAHASASPWEGRNALDAFVQAYDNISMLRQAMKPTDKIHGIITHGGDAPNIIPDYTRSEWYVRAATPQRVDELVGRFRGCMEGAATATGCRLTMSGLGNDTTDLISDPVLGELFDANISALGRTMQRGADRDPSRAGSTDMGNVSHVVPSIHPMLDINSGDAVNHQSEFAAHTITADGDRAIRDGALGMAWTIIDLATGNRWADLGG